MKKYLFILVMNVCLLTAAYAAPVFKIASIDYVFAGYPGGGTSFIPVGGTVNPANCTTKYPTKV